MEETLLKKPYAFDELHDTHLSLNYVFNPQICSIFPDLLPVGRSLKEVI